MLYLKITWSLSSLFKLGRSTNIKIQFGTVNFGCYVQYISRDANLERSSHSEWCMRTRPEAHPLLNVILVISTTICCAKGQQKKTRTVAECHYNGNLLKRHTCMKNIVHHALKKKPLLSRQNTKLTEMRYFIEINPVHMGKW